MIAMMKTVIMVAVVVRVTSLTTMFIQNLDMRMMAVVSSLTPLVILFGVDVPHSFHWHR